MDMKVCGVYKITSPSGKIYIGSSKNINIRKNRYKKLHCKEQIKIYRSLLKYGWEVHTFEIIAITEPEKRYKWEHILGMYYNVLGENGLNCVLPGYDGIPPIFSDEYREKMSKTITGKKQTTEAIEKSRQARKGVKRSQET